MSITLPPDTPETVRHFVADTIARATAAGVAVEFSPDRFIAYPTGNLPTSGFFCDAPDLRLGVATGKPLEQWLGVLVHESCHMDQWLAGDAFPPWKSMIVDGRDVVELLDEWLEGKKEVPRSTVSEWVANIQVVEHDCERRVLEKVRQYGLPIDPVQYARAANAYVMFYEYVEKARRWYSGAPPYEQPEILREVPSSLDVAYRPAPAGLMRAFERVYGPLPSIPPAPSRPVLVP